MIFNKLYIYRIEEGKSIKYRPPSLSNNELVMSECNNVLAAPSFHTWDFREHFIITFIVVVIGNYFIKTFFYLLYRIAQLCKLFGKAWGLYLLIVLLINGAMRKLFSIYSFFFRVCLFLHLDIHYQSFHSQTFTQFLPYILKRNTSN